MTYRGTAKDGVVVIEGSQLPPEGAAAVVEISAGAPADAEQLTGEEREILTGQNEALAQLVEMAEQTGQFLPTDASRNVKHYLYGAPKR